MATVTNKPTNSSPAKTPRVEKSLYYLAIRKDKARGLYPTQCQTLGGLAFHARTATWDEEAQEPSYQPGQLQRITEEQARRAEVDAKKFHVQWSKVEGGWKSEVVDPTSRIYEAKEERRHPETGAIMEEEVELWPYIVLRRHADEELPPVPPQALAAARSEGAAADAAARGVEAEEERADPRAFAADKREQAAAKNSSRP